MRLIDVDNKLQSDGQKNRAKAMFGNAYKMYFIFRALKLKLVGAEQVKAAARRSRRL